MKAADPLQRRSEKSAQAQEPTHRKSAKPQPSRKALKGSPSQLVLIIEYIVQRHSFFRRLLKPSIKLLDCLLKTKLAFGLFPSLEIHRRDEELASDFRYRNAVFPNDFAEIAQRVACFVR